MTLLLLSKPHRLLFVMLHLHLLLLLLLLA